MKIRGDQKLFLLGFAINIVTIAVCIYLKMWGEALTMSVPLFWGLYLLARLVCEVKEQNTPWSMRGK